jgi:hypothetical protein
VAPRYSRGSDAVGFRAHTAYPWLAVASVGHHDLGRGIAVRSTANPVMPFGSVSGGRTSCVPAAEAPARGLRRALDQGDLFD